MRKPAGVSATAGGFAALVIWSTTVAIIRGATESLGTLTAAALATGLGGALAMALAWRRGRSPAAMLGLPLKYLLGCGALFVIYMVCMYTALGWSANRSTTLVVGLVNHLWAVLTVVLSVPILHRRARWPVGLGCVLAVGGMAVAVLGNEQFHWGRLGEAGPGVAGPLLLAAVAAVAWGLYSNLVKRWGRPDAGAVPLFLLASAAVLAMLRLGKVETTTWTPKATGELCVIVVFQSAVAYAL